MIERERITEREEQPTEIMPVIEDDATGELTVSLGPRGRLGLEYLTRETGKPEVDLVNYALELYAWIEKRQRAGAEFFTREPDEPGIRTIGFH